jgi:hypothetical protein
MTAIHGLNSGCTPPPIFPEGLRKTTKNLRLRTDILIRDLPNTKECYKVGCEFRFVWSSEYPYRQFKEVQFFSDPKDISCCFYSRIMAFFVSFILRYRINCVYGKYSRSQWPRGLRHEMSWPLERWDRGFESH